MTCYLSHELTLAARVSSFQNPDTDFAPKKLSRSGCLVKITHASIGSTDVLARRGGYLLHPLPGFTTGYDFVGIIAETDSAAAKQGLSVGDRVAGILPRMGAHATQIRVPASLLTPVPQTLDSESAATLPLDGVTAKHALALQNPNASSIFISGVSGSVGILAAQLAKLQQLKVVGTASRKSADVAQKYHATVFDYSDEIWQQKLMREFGKADGAIDHTGARNLGAILASKARIARIGFGANVRHQKMATATGSARTLARRFTTNPELLCSTPIYVASKREAYRKDLALLLSLAADTKLETLKPEVYVVKNFQEALDAAAKPNPGVKTVLAFS